MEQVQPANSKDVNAQNPSGINSSKQWSPKPKLTDNYNFLDSLKGMHPNPTEAPSTTLLRTSNSINGTMSTIVNDQREVSANPTNESSWNQPFEGTEVPNRGAELVPVYCAVMVLIIICVVVYAIYKQNKIRVQKQRARRKAQTLVTSQTVPLVASVTPQTPSQKDPSLSADHQHRSGHSKHNRRSHRHSTTPANPIITSGTYPFSETTDPAKAELHLQLMGQQNQMQPHSIELQMLEPYTFNFAAGHGLGESAIINLNQAGAPGATNSANSNFSQFVQASQLSYPSPVAHSGSSTNSNPSPVSLHDQQYLSAAPNSCPPSSLDVRRQEFIVNEFQANSDVHESAEFANSMQINHLLYYQGQGEMQQADNMENPASFPFAPNTPNVAAVHIPMNNPLHSNQNPNQTPSSNSNNLN